MTEKNIRKLFKLKAKSVFSNSISKQYELSNKIVNFFFFFKQNFFSKVFILLVKYFKFLFCHCNSVFSAAKQKNRNKNKGRIAENLHCGKRNPRRQMRMRHHRDRLHRKLCEIKLPNSIFSRESHGSLCNGFPRSSN